MSKRVTWKLTMELLSDAIFGSGFSVPGGEDIAVYQDEAGYPYLKGSTLKGLLKESLENLLAWSGVEDISGELLGTFGWEGTTDARRIQLTALTLINPPQDTEDCYSNRVFTALENGVVKQKTLRAAACIRRGLRFHGEVSCAEEDSLLVQQAFSGIKWAGTMRNRGFGRVRICMERLEASNRPRANIPACRCLHYRLYTELPIIITDLAASSENSYETRGYIPGSAIRGMVASTLAVQDPEWFAQHKVALLSDQTRFLNALPAPIEGPVLPTIKGFYEDKAETFFESVVKDGTFTPGFKRAKTGEFCTIEGNQVRYWRAETTGSLRIQKGAAENNSPLMFQTKYLCSGQEFDGYVVLDDSTIASKIAEAFTETVWLGADRYEGFGKCSVKLLEMVDEPEWIAAYGYHEGEIPDCTLYMVALSPLAMLDEFGNPCGVNETELARMMGIEKAKTVFCSTSMSEYDAYNRTWKCRTPSIRMYDSGSVFQLVCDQTPDIQAIRRIQREGIGIRRAEGFGQVLFLRKDLFEGLQKKVSLISKPSEKQNRTAEVRRTKYRWVMEQAKTVNRCGLSPSQLGTVQAMCEKALAQSGDVEELYAFLDKNLKKGARNANRFKKVDGLIRAVLGVCLDKTLGVSGVEDSMKARLELLCLLFDHSRKIGKEDK